MTRWRSATLQHAVTVAATLALTAYAVVLFSNISFAAAGSDSSGYLNLARMIARGRASYVIEPLRTLGLDNSWIDALTPIGFTWGKANTGTMAPGYPPGLPVHMVLAATFGGWKIAPFLISPLAAIACGIMMFAVGRELGLSRPGSVLSAILLLVLPQTIAHAVQPVSDVLATFWALVAMWCVLRSQRTLWVAVLGGAAYAIGVWVRPTNALLLLPLLVAARLRPSILLRFVAGGAPFGVALLAYQARVYGNPLQTAYGTVGHVVSFGGIETCARIFAKYLTRISTPFVFPAGLLVIFDPRRDRWTRAMLPLWFAVFFAFYCLWAPFDDWWALRFLLPGMPGLIFGAILLLESFATVFRPRAQRVSAAVIAVLIAAVTIGRPIILDKEYRVLDTDEQEEVYRDAVLWAEQRLPKDAVVMSGALSGSFFYYSDRFTVRPDRLDDERFQLLRAYAGSRGLRWYAVIIPGEDHSNLPNVFSGNWRRIDTLGSIELWRLDS